MKHSPLFWLAAVAILLLAALLRFVNLGTTPGWYTDEATHLEIVRHLLNGRIQYFAINQSTLLFSRLPLFELLLATAVSLFDYSMLTLRGLTASLGVISVGVMMAVVRQISRDQLFALLSGLLLAIFPPAILYSRFGFSYNLLVPLLLLTIYGMWLHIERQSQRGLLLVAICLGLGIISDLLMLAFVPIFGLIIIWTTRHQLNTFDGLRKFLQQMAWVLLFLLLPFGLFTVVSLLSSPSAFWFDLQFVLFRLSPSWAEQLQLLFQNGWRLGQMGGLVLGFVGLFWIRPSSLRWLLFSLLLLPLIILGRTASLYSLGFYYMIPFLPFFALGIAGLIRYGGEWVLDRVNKQWVFVVFMSIPLLFSIGQTWQLIQTGWLTDIEPFLLASEDVQKTAEFLTEVTADDSLSIASPTVGFLLDGQVADFQMGTAVQGMNTPHLPADLPADRYVFNPEIAGADIVVIDKLWHNWAQFHVPGVAEMMGELQTMTPLFQSGEIVVYRYQTEIK